MDFKQTQKTPFLYSFALVNILLLFLSGTFPLSRISPGLPSVEVRFLLFSILFFVFIIMLAKIPQVPKHPRMPAVLAFVWFFLSFLTIFYSPDTIVATKKLVDLALILFSVLMFSALLHRHREPVRVLGIFFVVVGTIYAIATISTYLLADGSRGGIMLGGPNVATRVMFFSAAFCMFFYVSTGCARYLLLFFIAFGGILLVGSRAGIGAALLCLAIAFLYYEARRKSAAKSRQFISLLSPRNIFLIGTGLVASYWYAWDFFQRRFIRLVLERFHWAGRDRLYELSIERSLDALPFGEGLAGYKQYMAYPHNLLLELALDGGFLLTWLWLSFLILSLYVFFKAKGPLVFISIIPFYMFFVQQFSGEAYDFRYFFLFSALSLLLLRRKSIYAKQASYFSGIPSRHSAHLPAT